MALLSCMNTFTSVAAVQRSAFLGSPPHRPESRGSFRPFSQFSLPVRRYSYSPRLTVSTDDTTGTDTTSSTDTLSRNDFPSDFLFGAGCSAFQAEGNVGGRGSSIWDAFVHTPGKISDGRVHYPGIDFFNLYEGDIKLAKELGFEAFRFSISWPRLFPHPNGEESVEGIEFYNRIINAVIRAGLKPWVTIFHWETPQYLENDPDILGFRTKNILPHFIKLADTCFKHFGDRVKLWVTVNELWTFANYGYSTGSMAPGRCSSVSGNECDAGDSSTEIYLAAHNLLLAHAKAYRLYCNRYKTHQGGVIGFNPVDFGAAPYSSSEEDILATERFLEFFSGWQSDPVVFGDYPASMRERLGDRLPEFTEEETEELKNSVDFFGRNYYSAYFIKNAEVPEDVSLRWYGNDGGYSTELYNDAGEIIGDAMGTPDAFIHNCAKYLPPLFEWLEARYGDIPNYICENGVMDPDASDVEQCINDQQRITYIKDHMTEIANAISEKKISYLKGHFYWSFQDVFEWDSGFSNQFGLIHVETEEGKDPVRTIKNSAKWYKQFLAK